MMNNIGKYAELRGMLWKKLQLTLSAAITMYNDKGDLVAAGIASGVGVAR